VRDPIGVVLAGGAGRRLGGSKAAVKLAGRPLISYPLDALGRALGAVAVVAKLDSELPALPGVTVWIEPPEPRHPLTGIVHALRCANGRPVVVCATDLPLVSAALIRSLAEADAGAAPAVLAWADGRIQPTLGRYGSEALGPLARALERPDQALTEMVEALRPKLLEVSDAEELFNVNTPEDLLHARAGLERRRPTQPNVKS
jgi:molybdopterin-guanine dinucleotide biosynthesis protein A